MATDRDLPPWPRACLAALAACAVAGALVLIREERMATTEQPARWLRLTLALAPALFAALAGFHPAILTRLRAQRALDLAWGGALLVLWVVLLSADRFNPYALVILAGGAGAAVYALRDGVPPGRLGAAGLAVWMLLWIPFDLRWYRGAGGHMELFLSDKGGYAIGALLVTARGVLAFGVVGKQPQGLDPPRALDLPKALALLLVYGAIALPAGLATGFLVVQPKLGLGQALLTGLGLALIVALPEELFFRGILDTGLRRVFKPAWLSLLVSSVLFGLMHWNNRDELRWQLIYFALATVAGVFYGLAYRWTGRLFAAILVHTLVDLFWQAFLRG